MQVLKKVLLCKYSLFIIFILIMLLSFFRTNLEHKSVYNGGEDAFKLKVLDIKYKENSNTITFQGNERLVSYIKDFPYDVGDIVNVKGILIRPKNNTIPNLFNYRKYLQSRKIYWELKVSDISLIKKNSNIFYKIKNLIRLRIKSIPNNEYLYAFILGDTSYFNTDTRDKYQTIGLNYVLSLGSFQIMIITFFLDKLRMRDKRKMILKIIVIIIYIAFTNLVIGILRSGLCYIIKSVLKYNKIKYRYCNLILIVGIILLLFNPYYINNIGFLYSFSISLAISILNKKIIGNYYKRLLIISSISFIVSLPINIYSNYEINVLAIIFSVIMVPLFHFIIIPLCMIVLIFPFFSPLFNLIIMIVEKLINIFSSISISVLIFRKPSMLIIIVYYLLIILFFYKRKYLYLLIIALLFHYNINYIIQEKIITFLDVNEGDAIILKNNNTLSLIDNGGSKYNEYSDEIVKYIKSLGISKINNMIISHGDMDHLGSSIGIINKIKVDRVIFNCGSNTTLEEELIKKLLINKINYYSCIKELDISRTRLLFLQTRDYGDENNNSNVIYTKIDNYSFLFMGDAGVVKEKDILDKYNISDIDVLKVGHHGSKTSSSIDFINKINPKYSIISVGKNNFYGHPDKDILNNLKNSKIYRTDQDGSIVFKIKNNKLIIENNN